MYKYGNVEESGCHSVLRLICIAQTPNDKLFRTKWLMDELPDTCLNRKRNILLQIQQLFNEHPKHGEDSLAQTVSYLNKACEHFTIEREFYEDEPFLEMVKSFDWISKEYSEKMTSELPLLLKHVTNLNSMKKLADQGKIFRMASEWKIFRVIKWLLYRHSQSKIKRDS